MSERTYQQQVWDSRREFEMNDPWSLRHNIKKYQNEKASLENTAKAIESEIAKLQYMAVQYRNAAQEADNAIARANKRLDEITNTKEAHHA